jgi:phosphoglucosamine mutase
MDIQTATMIGFAVAGFFKNEKTGGRIIVGQDTRISGDMLAHAVTAGICSAGINVELLGVLPTPAIAHATVESGSIAGIVISASHNPFEDNGIKVFDNKGHKISIEQEERIEELVFRRPNQVEIPNNVGIAVPKYNIQSTYLKYLKDSISGIKLSGMLIALDCAHGATYKIAPELFRALGAEVIALNCEPTGTNINAQCGSQYPQTLSKEVKRHSADIGLAFDGDGDRVIAVDETGTILSGDHLIAICAADLQKKKRLKNNIVITTVMSNMGFHNALNRLGIKTVSSAVGDRNVFEAMKAHDAVLGGEDSGHIIFLDKHTTGDGLLAGLQVIDAMRTGESKLSALAKIITLFPQVLVNVKVREKIPFADIPEIIAEIKKTELTLGSQGRVLVRYSGTENLCRVMVEGPTKGVTNQYAKTIADVVRRKLG